MKINELNKPGELTQFRNDIKNKVPSTNKYELPLEQNIRLKLKSYMEKYGFKLTGSGVFSEVFVHPDTNYVYKVFAKSNNYLKWLQFAHSNTNNPMVPRIKSKPSKIFDEYYYVALETLDTDRMKSDFVASILMASISGIEIKEEQLRLLPNLGLDIQSDHYSNIVEYLRSEMKSGVILDIHSGNIMYRGNQPVVIDPVSR